jgi:hypothetical protein
MLVSSLVTLLICIIAIFFASNLELLAQKTTHTVLSMVIGAGVGVLGSICYVTTTNVADAHNQGAGEETPLSKDKTSASPASGSDQSKKNQQQNTYANTRSIVLIPEGFYEDMQNDSDASKDHQSEPFHIEEEVDSPVSDDYVDFEEPQRPSPFNFDKIGSTKINMRHSFNRPSSKRKTFT